ncbi:hypothetical protein COU79_01955, partial [Candidatus Peregrinibacteria bacterium CG10_big_fil_rev_8_21_14_0_10_54_7]
MVQGDTMTGGLLINVGGVASASIDSSLALEVVGTMSGRVLHAQDLLTTSGAFIVEGNSTFNGNVLLARATRFSGSLIPSITNKYDLGSGALRFRSLYLSGSSLHIGKDGDESTIGYDTIGDRIVFDADSDGDFDFRMSDIGSFDIATVAADSPTDSGYARIFAKGEDGTAGNDPNTTVLLHMNNNTTNDAEGTTNANTFYGSCPYTFSSSVKKFGSHSWNASCTGYQLYRYGGSNTDDYFVNGDFTVDLWVYEGAHTNTKRFLIDSSAYFVTQWGLFIGNGNKLGAEIQLANGKTFTMTGTSALETGQWIHVALERNGNSFNLYHSGSLVATTTDANDLAALSYHYLMLGNRYPYNWIGDENFSGYLDEVRISKNARYSSSSFTPPTGAYEESSGGLFVRLSDGTLIELGSTSAGSAGDGVWTVRSDNNIYYSLGRVGVGASDPLAALEVRESAIDGPAAIFVNQDGAGTGMLLDSESNSHPGMALSMLDIVRNNNTVLNPHLLFGYANTFDTNLYRDSANVLRTDDTFEVGSTMSGASLTVSNLRNCDTIDTDASGTLACGTDGGGQQSDTDARYVNVSGDTMTGGLLIHATNDGSKTVQAGVLLEVGGVMSGRTLHAQDTLSSSGNLVVDGTVTFNGVTYAFPASDGSASGKVLKTNSAGQLSWSSDIDTDTNTTYSAGQGLTLGGTVFRLSDSFSGTSLEI